MSVFLVDVVIEFNAIVDLFCFEWIRDERKVDWYHLDVIFIFEFEEFFLMKSSWVFKVHGVLSEVFQESLSGNLKNFSLSEIAFSSIVWLLVIIRLLPWNIAFFVLNYSTI